MIEHPIIPGRRQLSGELLTIHQLLMAIIPRLDLAGEHEAASHIVEAVERLVDAPPCSELTVEEHVQAEEAYDAYRQAVDDHRFSSFG